MELDYAAIEILAEAAHAVWMDGKLRDGWIYDPVTDKANKRHSCLLPYADLTEADKVSDRDLVIGIPYILEKAGFMLVTRFERMQKALAEFEAAPENSAAVLTGGRFVE
jgi:hypothetical protein